MSEPSGRAQDPENRSAEDHHQKSSTGLRRKILLALVATVLTYGICEAVATTLYVHGWIGSRGIFVHERTDPQGNVRRDRSVGYLLSSTPSRIAVVAPHGGVVSEGIMKGNNYVFSDHHDFTLRRESDEELRFAVLGDSFTAEVMLKTSWPDRVEELLDGRPKTLRLFNMSMDGGGLGNWWSILHRWIGVRDMELDGIILAVACDDLDRHFFWWDDMLPMSPDSPRPSMHGEYVSTWDPDADPFQHSNELTSFDPMWQVVTPDEFDGILNGTWTPTLPERPFRLYLGAQLLGLLRHLSTSGEPEYSHPQDDPSEGKMRERLIADIREFAASRGLRVLVLHVTGYEEQRDEASSFAETLGADFMYLDYGGDKIPYEGHWRQSGSDGYAENIAPKLYEWAVNGAQ